MAARLKPDVSVFTVDTDFLFPESVALREQLRGEVRHRPRVLRGEVTLDEQNRRHGLDLWQRDTDQCCALRKVEPTERALDGLDAWIAGLRRDQSATRADIDVARALRARRTAAAGQGESAGALDAARTPGTTSSSTTCRTTRCSIRAISRSAAGRAPSAVGAGDDERAGRWGGQKAECGIHTFMARKG